MGRGTSRLSTRRRRRSKDEQKKKKKKKKTEEVLTSSKIADTVNRSGSSDITFVIDIDNSHDILLTSQ